MKTMETMLGHYLRISNYIFELDGDYMQMKDTLKNQQETVKKEFTKDQQDFLRELEDTKGFLDATEVETAFFAGSNWGHRWLARWTFTGSNERKEKNGWRVFSTANPPA